MSVFTLLHEKKNLLHEKILFPGLLLPTDPAVGELENLVYIIPFLNLIVLSQKNLNQTKKEWWAVCFLNNKTTISQKYSCFSSANFDFWCIVQQDAINNFMVMITLALQTIFTSLFYCHICYISLILCYCNDVPWCVQIIDSSRRVVPLGSHYMSL